MCFVCLELLINTAVILLLVVNVEL